MKYSQDPSGERDRQSLDIMVGALPSPKGPTFIGNAVFGGSTSPKGGGGEGDEPIQVFDGDDDINQLFPPASNMQERLKMTGLLQK